MLGITDKPYSVDGKTLEPMIAHGLQVASVGVLIDPDQPMIWRDYFGRFRAGSSF